MTVHYMMKMMSGSKALGFVLFGMFLSKMVDGFFSGNKKLPDNNSGHSNCGKKDNGGWSSSTLSSKSSDVSSGTSSNYGIGHGPYNTSWQPSYGWM